MFAAEIKKLKSYPQTIFGTHLPVILDLENIQVKMYNHPRRTTIYSQNFPKDTNPIHNSLCKKENIPEEKRITVAHIRQLSSFVDSDKLVY